MATTGAGLDAASRAARSRHMSDLRDDLAACRICAERFAATATCHRPNPVVWFAPGARILIASQAPGLRVHEANTPFWDQSGKRLRRWLGMSEEVFYDRSRVAIVPMAFCFPGYDAKGSDLPPPKVCAATWRDPVLDYLGSVRLKVLIGGYAQQWHLGRRQGVTKTVAEWREHAPEVFPLPHPSWRNTAFLKKNPWVEDELVPALQARVKEVLEEDG